MEYSWRTERIRRIKKDRCFSISPRIVPVNEPVQISIADPNRLLSEVEGALIEIVPVSYFDRDTPNPRIEVEFRNGQIAFQHTFSIEQEYIVKVCDPDGLLLGVEFGIYALESDLAKLLPLKGDLHMHTAYSDGFEPPSLKLAKARQRGLDFVAITDHNNYNGSVVAQESLSKCPSRMVVLRGEEVHAGGKHPGDAVSPVHILSIDAEYGIAPFKAFDTHEHYQQLREYYESSFAEIIQENPWMEGTSKEECLARVDRTMARRKELADQQALDSSYKTYSVREYAFTKDACEEIKAAGGLCVLCHPLWRPIRNVDTTWRADVSLSLVEKLLSEDLFDAYECVSGAPKSNSGTNQLQEQVFRELGSADSIPLIGITDNHAAVGGEYDLLGSNYTLVFAQSNSAAGIREAIESGRSVAVEHYNEEDARIHGSLRLSMYAAFLIQSFFVEHDENAAIEGKIMEKAIMHGLDSYTGLLRECCEKHEAEEARWKASI